MKVLIADDDAISRRLLQSYLEKWGHEAAVAQNGAEAWDLFQAGEYPMVISDWMMPEMDGVELIRRIRAGEQGLSSGHVYAILLTARTQKEDLVAGMEAGADDFVTKPFDRDELRVRLREGERIVRLEQRLIERDRALRAAQAIEGEIAGVTDALESLQRELRTATDTIPARKELAQRLTMCLERLHHVQETLATLRGEGLP